MPSVFFFSPSTACAVDNASPTSITSAIASSWAVQSILPSRPWGSKVSSQTVPAICSPRPKPGRPHPKHPARPLPKAWDDGQAQSEHGCPKIVPNPTICFILSLSVLDISSSFPQAPLHTCPQLGQTHHEDGDPGGTLAWHRAELGCHCSLGMQMGCCSLFIKYLRTCFQHSKGCREYPNTAQGTQPCKSSQLLLTKKKVCMKLLRRSFACSSCVKSLEICWDSLYHPSVSLTLFPAGTFCLHCLDLCWPQTAPGVQCLWHCTAVPKPRLSKYIYIMLQLWVIPLNLVAKVLGQ